MQAYRYPARKHPYKIGDGYKELVQLYTDIEEAVKWNQRFLEEIEKGRRRLNGTKCGKRQKERSLPSERDKGPGVRHQVSSQCILIGAWQWIKNHIGGK